MRAAFCPHRAVSFQSAEAACHHRAGVTQPLREPPARACRSGSVPVTAGPLRVSMEIQREGAGPARPDWRAAILVIAVRVIRLLVRRAIGRVVRAAMRSRINGRRRGGPGNGETAPVGGGGASSPGTTVGRGSFFTPAAAFSWLVSGDFVFSGPSPLCPSFSVPASPFSPVFRCTFSAGLSFSCRSCIPSVFMSGRSGAGCWPAVTRSGTPRARRRRDFECSAPRFLRSAAAPALRAGAAGCRAAVRVHLRMAVFTPRRVPSPPWCVCRVRRAPPQDASAGILGRLNVHRLLARRRGGWRFILVLAVMFALLGRVLGLRRGLGGIGLATSVVGWRNSTSTMPDQAQERTRNHQSRLGLGYFPALVFRWDETVWLPASRGGGRKEFCHTSSRIIHDDTPPRA